MLSVIGLIGLVVGVGGLSGLALIGDSGPRVRPSSHEAGRRYGKRQRQR